jgi:hypothetical protein
MAMTGQAIAAPLLQNGKTGAGIIAPSMKDVCAGKESQALAGRTTIRICQSCGDSCDAVVCDTPNIAARFGVGSIASRSADVS